MESFSDDERDLRCIEQAESSPGGSLPKIPGGWTLQEIAVGSKRISIIKPAIPDRFLEDPCVIAANRQDDYMPYWSYLWPSALPMARALNCAGWDPGTEILELGCGVGLVGLAALAQDWDVTFSDYDQTALACAMFNARSNGWADRAHELYLDWREPIDRQWPVILACDIAYEASCHSPLLDLLDRMLAPRGVCWIGDPGRTRMLEFYQLAQERGFRTRIWDEQGKPSSFPAAGHFQIIELRHQRPSTESRSGQTVPHRETVR